MFLIRKSCLNLKNDLKLTIMSVSRKSMIMNIDSIATISPKTSGRFEASLINE
ncbi:hypothetical protein ACL9ST_17615 [Bacillus australimaris]|uniref:hypothetical protein n=1 Tax=Bacillus australimaris TaxID=1326968 RepID=UPI0039B37FDC